MEIQLISILLLISLVFSSCESHTLTRLKPGDKIAGTLLTTGATNAVPLWFLCPSGQNASSVTAVECTVPSHIRLSIGFALGVPERALAQLNWSASDWEVSVDNQPVDLAAFGTYDQILPTILNSPSRIRNVMIKVTAWNVVLESVKQGTHAISGHLHTKAKTYQWIINIHFE